MTQRSVRAAKKERARAKRKGRGRPSREPRELALARHLEAVTEGAGEVVDGVLDTLEAGEEVTINLDLRPRAVDAAELELWHEYADKIGLGAVRDGYQVVVILPHGVTQDSLLVKLRTRARVRLRECRLQEDGASLWFELKGPDGWVRVGRKVQVELDAEGASP